MATASPMRRRPVPQFSRPWAVTTTTGVASSVSSHPSSGTPYGTCWPAAHRNASIPVLPVTKICSWRTRSWMRFSALVVVGARWKAAIRVTS